MLQQRAHLGHGHLRLFFPPHALAAEPRRPALVARVLCDGANPSIRVSRTRRDRILPSPIGCLPRSSIASHAPAPTSTGPLPLRHWSDGTSVPALGPTIAAPAIAR